jgi:hypothetical protein
VQFIAADKLVTAAMNKETLDASKIEAVYKNYDADMDKALLKFRLEAITKKLGSDNTNIKLLAGTPESLAGSSVLSTKEGALGLLSQGNDAILKSNDPFIKFAVATYARMNELKKKSEELRNITTVNKELIGRATFEVYNTTIPPDATFTLRISDGVIKSYNYNGTIAPPKTTFYGYYDRYYSFDKQYPWTLPERFINPPAEFDRSTAFNFISTNDIIGGNSGSPVINKDGEIVGLAFDGNIESLSDNYIYTTEVPHTVSLDSEGMIQVIKNLYKVKRLAEELRSGKLYTE